MKGLVEFFIEPDPEDDVVTTAVKVCFSYHPLHYLFYNNVRIRTFVLHWLHAFFSGWFPLFW